MSSLPLWSFSSPERLPYYNLYRERAALEALESAERAERVSTVDATQPGSLLRLHTEKKLVSIDGLLVGRPDFIDAASREIIDYKTGVTPDGATDTVSATEVRQLRLYVHLALDNHRVPDKYAVVPKNRWRKPDCPVFGVVGTGYTPLQNREAFDFFDPIVGEGAAIYHTAGALGDGERVWILAKLPSVIQVAEGDIADKYLLLSNSHDGNSSVQIKFTPIRVVCNNTLTMALKTGPTIRVSHTRDLRERLEKAHKVLGLINTHFERLETTFRDMAKVHIDEDRLKVYLRLVFPDPRDPDDTKAIEHIKKERDSAGNLFRRGMGNQAKPVAGTLWAAYNGVAEFIDHATKGRQRLDHLEQIWFGDGYFIKARAFEVARKEMLAWRLQA